MVCLKSTYSLRSQLLLSFGTISSIVIVAVFISASICLAVVRNTIQEESSSLFKEQVTSRIIQSSRHAAEVFRLWGESDEHVVNLLHDIVSDRIVGYPNDGWEDDVYVPFRDMDSPRGTNKYPLNSKPLPLDWSIDFANIINDTNKNEHLQERVRYYDEHLSYRLLSTASASYFMQGSCDPNETDINSPVYYLNCTDANNNVTTGGVVHPTSTNKGLYEKSADIGIFLKPLYESHSEILQLSVYFHNEGAGAMIHYPASLPSVVGTQHDNVTLTAYVSAGCEWMRTFVYLDTKERVVSDEEISRCHPKGTLVHPREYNINDFEWYQGTIFGNLQWPTEVGWHIVPQHPFGNGEELPVFVLSRCVFDRRTNRYVGMVTINVAVEELSGFVSRFRIDHNVDVAVVDVYGGYIFADTLNIAKNSPNISIYKSDFITEEDYGLLISMLPHPSAKLTPKELDEMFSKIVLYSSDFFYTIYPLYVNNGDSSVVAIHRAMYDVYDEITEIKHQIDKELILILASMAIIGIIGLLLTMGIIWGVSRSITRPLLQMERAAWEIVNHDSDKKRSNTKSTSIEVTIQQMKEPFAKTCCRCFPQTEVTQLVQEFGKMINGFSGEGASKVAVCDAYEVKTTVAWQSDFHKLYKRTDLEKRKKSFLDFIDELRDKDESRFDAHSTLSFLHNSSDRDFAWQEQSSESRSVPSVPALYSSSIYPAPPKFHFGSNIRYSSSGKMELSEKLRNRQTRPCQSCLFWLILVSIVLPLAITMLLICHNSGENMDISSEFWFLKAKNTSLEFEVETLQSITKSKSDQLVAYLRDITRDLHVATRVAGWLHFEAINTSDAFTELRAGSEECRNYSPPSDDTEICPIFLSDPPPCFCEWDDLHNLSCTRSKGEDTRNKQLRHMFGQRRDVDITTGHREKAATFGVPGVDDDPSNTLWWSNFSEMPGADKGSKASGYATTYDRLRVSSALAVVDLPLYNYIQEKRWFLGSMIAFEADGLGTGYRGCEQSYAYYSSFKSTTINNASNISSDLCPLGKFGYDPRCRSWYNSGKKSYLSEGRSLHFTSAYQYVSGDFVGVSATAPLTNPKKDEYIGQFLLDFSPFIAKPIERLDKSKSFVITLDKDERNDTVLGSDGQLMLVPTAVGDLLLPSDNIESEYRRVFDQDVLKAIKNVTGPSIGTVEFLRTIENATQDQSNETVTLVYKFVPVRGLVPIDPSDVRGGIEVSSFPVYAVCSVLDEGTKYKRWNEIYNVMYNEQRNVRKIFFMVCGALFLLFCAGTFKITMDVTRPMIILLRVVQMINDGTIENDIPPLYGGSREVHQVYASFAKLIRIVRMSNVSFFSGDLPWAYEFIGDALKLFRKIGDEKAQGIACTNLGNTLHVMYGNAVYSDDCCAMIPGICCLKSAIEHYNIGITMAECELSNVIGERERIEFAQQLADRLFNRGLFLLLVYNEGCAPEDAKASAVLDIVRTKELDDYVKSFFFKEELVIEKSSDCFNRWLRRSLGLLRLYGDEELQQLWDVRTMLIDADHLLVTLWDHSTAPLFDDISREGRRQELECVAIQYGLLRGNNFEAASAAIRMFVEDEYLIDDSFKIAATALLEFMRDDSSRCWSPETKSHLKSDLRAMLRRRRGIDVDAGKCLVFALELHNCREDDPILEKISTLCLTLYDECCFDDDFVGIVSYTSTEIVNLSLCLKAENEGIQKSSIDLATASACEGSHPTSPFAIQMIVDSSESKELDSYILLVTDGSSFDRDLIHALKQQIQHMNEVRETNTHMLIVGFELQDENVVEEYKSLCNVSKLSTYINATSSMIETAFITVTNLLRGPANIYGCDKGLTMERF